MKSAATGTVSGCIVWVIVVFVLSLCLVPVALTVGLFTSLSGSGTQFIAENLGPYLCPPGSTAEILSQQTSGVDSEGNRYDSTSYQMQCVDSSGNVVREPSQDYAIYWWGILGAAGLIVSALLAFLFAAPAGVIIVKIINRMRSNKTAVS